MAWVWPGPPRPRLRGVAVLCLFLWCWPPVAWLITASLEARYRYLVVTPDSGAQAIVALSGAVWVSNPSRPIPILGATTQERVAYTAWLFHHGFHLPVLASGGPFDGGSAAELMADQLRLWKVDPVWTETASSSTRENAEFGARLLRQKGIRRIVLVTEAFHMRRAEAAFRKAGLEVIPSPCSFRTLESGTWLDFLLPKARAILWNEDAVHEWIGMLWYAIKGR